MGRSMPDPADRDGLVPDHRAKITPMTLTEFLLARIAEDEALALRITPGRQAKNGRWNRGSIQDQAVRTIDPLHADHMGRHDPARVLAECDAKRYIVDIHSGWHTCPDEDAVEDDDATEPAPCLTLRILAAVYAGHPDYRQDWRP